MSNFVWGKLEISVGEMSRAAALSAARDLDAYIQRADMSDLTAIRDFLVTSFVVHSPVRILDNGQVLDNGAHEIQKTQHDLPFTLELPMTEHNFRTLPASLADAWAGAADIENEWLSNRFLASLARMKDVLNTGLMPSEAQNAAD
jgi:hypothetical protein